MYTAQFYKYLPEEDIKRSMEQEGFPPVKVSDKPHTVYTEHSHKATKLIAILSGDMQVVIEGKVYHCQKGDRVKIPGSTKHSAEVGPSGCEYWWSEK